jgi:dTDP-4-dehydrorhamnose reductase
MSALVVGASGLLGGHLLDLRPDAAGTYRRVARPGLRPVDLATPDSYRPLLRELRPTQVVLAANPRSLEWCETHPEQSHQEQVTDLEGFLAALAETRPDATVLLLSTDYVFDGEAAPYAEADLPRPLQAYGRDKLAAERAVAASGLAHWIVRTSVLYGESRWDPGTLAGPLRVLDAARDGSEFVANDDLRSCPTEVRSLARAVWALVGRGPGGMIHAAGGPALTRLAIARAVLEEWSVPAWPGLRSVSTDGEGRLPGQTLRRPRDSSLASGRLARILGAPLPSLAEGLRAVRARAGG